MICPRCQRENYPNAKFCLHCGAPLPQPPSRSKKVLFALLKSVGYYTLFLLVQTMVLMGYEIVVAMGEAFRMGLSGGTLGEDAIGDLTEDLMTALSQNIHILLILSAALTLLLLALFYRLQHKNPLTEMHITSAPLPPVALAVVLGIAVQFFVSITLTFLPLSQSLIDSFNEDRSTELLMGGGPLIVELLSVAVVTPIIEEVIFRGLIFTRLRRAMSVSLSVSLCAVFFGLVHGHIIAFVYAGLLGVLLCLLMLRGNNSILAPIACHMGFNFGSYLIGWTLGDTESVPLMLAVYMLSIALSVICGYLIFRRAPQTETE